MSLSRIAFSSIVLGGLASGASAVYVVADFTGVTPGVGVTVNDTANGISGFNTSAGGFNWNRTGGTATDPYLTGSYVTFCIDLKKTVGGGSNSYDQTSLDMAPTPSGLGTNYPMGATKAGLLGKLWGAHRASLSSSDDFGAFQLAVWEIIFENSGILNVGNGNFTATGAAGAEATANLWLSTVASAPAYGGVYALTGVNGAQDQLVPTPGSLSLCGLGGLIIARRRRR